MNLLKGICFVFAVIIIAQLLGLGIEGWGTSPATMIQLSASSGYYPYYQYNSGYRYPYYRYMCPYRDYYPSYRTSSRKGNWPRPYRSYKYY